MEQTDLFLLVLIGLSVLVGYARGFSDEILRLAIYVLSGTLGYVSAPYFQSVFSSVSNENVRKVCALLLGTFVAWFVLRMITAVLIQKIKESRFKKLDSSLGGGFGLIRACVALFIISFGMNFCAPHILRSSKILTLSGAGLSQIAKLSPDLEMLDPKNTEKLETVEEDWKKRLLAYLQNTKVKKEGEEVTLLSYLSSFVARQMTQDMRRFSQAKSSRSETASSETLQSMFEQQGGENLSAVIDDRDGKVNPQEDVISVEMMEKLAEPIFEAQLTALLNGQKPDENVLSTIMADKLKERMSENEHSGN